MLGYDTARSVDHDWGPRLQLFLSVEDSNRFGGEISTLLSEQLPKSIFGYPTNLITGDDGTTRHMQFTDGPVTHGVEVTGLGTWFTTSLGFDARAAVTTLEWLSATTQTLASVTSGAVFHDGLGELSTAREALAWYPLDVWRYVLACQWQRIAEEEPFIGRCGEVGDELGSAVVAARLVRDIMRLQLLQHRRSPPYSKWLGSAFAQLPDAPHLVPQLAHAMSAFRSKEREQALASVYEHAARMQNRLELAPVTDPATRPFHDRPFRVLHAERFAEVLRTSIADPAIRQLPLIGAIDQWIDNTTAIGRQSSRRHAQQAMTGGEDAPYVI